MNRFFYLLACCLASMQLGANEMSDLHQKLALGSIQPTEKQIELSGGKSVTYWAYEGIPYVAHIEDSTYQTLNFYVPQQSVESQTVPIFLRTYIGGYMASKATTPSATDATGRALLEGYVVCIPGSRGANSSITTSQGETEFTGIAPNGLLDLKAAIRYLKLNDKMMAGDATKIIVDGTSAGGAMASLVGATGNHPVYDPYLRKMGAAQTSDDIFAVVAYCPITDLEHADMAYEWLYSHTNSTLRGLSEAEIEVSNQLAAAYPTYLNTLKLRKEDGTLLTSENYMPYLKSFVIASMQRAQDEGATLPDTIGIVRYTSSSSMPALPPRGDLERVAPSFGPGGRVNRGVPRQSEFIEDVDMDRYLCYVAATQPLKSPPAFDSQGVVGGNASAENRVFGDSNGVSHNFTRYSLQKATHDANAALSEEMKQRVWMMNPMNFIANADAQKAPNWYIRHGLRDRDTAFQVSINLATLLKNSGFKVNFALPWNRPHSGDYNLNDLFDWINQLIHE